jgi:hypothetical protein
MFKAVSPKTLVIAAGLTLAACSGGGGGSSSPPPSPPPPPPSSNTAPEASVTVSAQAVDEGQPVTIDATGSSDADGDGLSFSISQTGGAPATENPPGVEAPSMDGVFVFGAPEIDADEVLTFVITVSDGEASDSATITVTANNIVLTPETVLFGQPVETLTGLRSPEAVEVRADAFGGPILGLAGVQDSADASGKELFNFPYNAGSQVFGALQGRAFPEAVETGRAVAISGSFEGPVTGSTNYAFEPGNVIVTRLQVPDGSTQDEAPVTIDVAGPCAGQALSGANVNDMVIGTRENGLLFFPNQGRTLNDPVEDRGKFEAPEALVATGEFCHLDTNEGVDTLFAYDRDAGAVRRWSVLTDDGRPEEIGPIEVSLPDGLDVVDMVAAQDNQGFFVVAFILSDGLHDGDHRIIVVSNDFGGGGTVQQVEYSWSKGIPSAAEIFETGVQGVSQVEDIFIVLETAPYAVVVEGEGNVTEGDLRPAFLNPVFAPLRLGVSDFSFGAGPGPDGRFLTVTLSGLGEVAFYPLSDTGQ